MTFQPPRLAVPSASKRSSFKSKLPSYFVPGEYTVICGRGRLCSDSPGNVYLKSLVKKFLQPYSEAKKKTEKSAIVSAILQMVQEASPTEGIFVREVEVPSSAFDDSSPVRSEWWEVDESFKREKIGCMFRDMLHTQYKSSTKSKHARKRELQKTARQQRCRDFNNKIKQQQQRINPIKQMSSTNDASMLQSSDCRTMSSSGVVSPVQPFPTHISTMALSKQQYNNEDDKSNSLLATMLHQHQSRMNNYHQMQQSSSSMMNMMLKQQSSSTASTNDLALSVVQEACQIIDDHHDSITDDDLQRLLNDEDDHLLNNLSMNNIDMDLPEGTLLSSVFD